MVCISVRVSTFTKSPADYALAASIRAKAAYAHWESSCLFASRSKFNTASDPRRPGMVVAWAAPLIWTLNSDEVLLPPEEPCVSWPPQNAEPPLRTTLLKQATRCSWNSNQARTKSQNDAGLHMLIPAKAASHRPPDVKRHTRE